MRILFVSDSGERLPMSLRQSWVNNESFGNVLYLHYQGWLRRRRRI